MSKKMLKRSLALGALMAFVITGSAMAAEPYVNKDVTNSIENLTVSDAEYIELSGSGSTILSRGWNKLTAIGDITVNATGNNKAIQFYSGDNSIISTNGNVYITSQSDDAIFVPQDDGGGKKTYTIKSENGIIDIKSNGDDYAIGNLSTHSAVIDVIGSTVNLTSAGRSALVNGYLRNNSYNNNPNNGITKITAGTLTIKGAAKDPSVNPEYKTAVVAVTAGSVNLDGKNKIEITNTSQVGYAIGVYDEAKFTAKTTGEDSQFIVNGDMNLLGGTTDISSTGILTINGKVKVASGSKKAQATFLGQKITFNANKDDEDAIVVNGNTNKLTIGDADTNTITINGGSDDGIFVNNGADVDLTAKEFIKITGGQYGLWLQGQHDGTEVNLTAENIEVSGMLTSGDAVVNYLGDTTITGTEGHAAIETRSGAVTNINTAGGSTVKIDGDIVYGGSSSDGENKLSGTSVNVVLDDVESYFKGAIYTAELVDEKYERNNDEASLNKGTVLTISNGATWYVTGDSFVNNLTANEGKIEFKDSSHVHVAAGSGSLILTESGKTADDLNTADQLTTVAKKLGVAETAKETVTAKVVMAEGKVKGETTGEVVFETKEHEYLHGVVKTTSEKVNTTNASVNNTLNVALMAWRAENNDMNKRLGELRNANGEHGVWVRMVNGESEYKDVENEYKTYQLGYDEKLSVDPSWTVGAAVSYTEADTTADKASGENKHKGFSVYGSKLNDDGSFVDLIAKVARIEHDFNVAGDKGDWSSNGYSLSAEYGKRLEQGNGLWIEPQVELTYGKISSAECELAGRTVTLEDMESLVGRVGFSLGKDIKQGNIYARASYLYDFEGETTTKFSDGKDTRSFEQDLGGGWWEVGVGANINLSKATYIYADVEKTFGGEVDTNWQWNLGVRYSF